MKSCWPGSRTPSASCARPRPGTTRTSPSACSARSSRGGATQRTRLTLRDRVLEPLGLARTGFDPPGPTRDRVLRRPVQRRGSRSRPSSPWRDRPRRWGGSGRPSTISRAGRTSSSTGTDGVLARETLDEMARVRTMVDDGAWSLGWGLGLALYRSGERVFVGHGGAMPGFLAARVRPPAGAHGRGRPLQHGRGRASGDTRARARGGGARSAASHSGALAAGRRRAGRRRAATGPLVVGRGGARALLAAGSAPARGRGRPAGTKRVVARAGGRRSLANRRGTRAG